MSTKQLGIQEIQRIAKELGDRLEQVSNRMPLGRRLRDKADRIRTLAKTLDVIAKTPNAAVNREALDAWLAELREAHAALKAWCKRMLRLDDLQADEDESDWDEIPF
ncbi:hypothetical protein [Tautonia marina]|uniref:hypothetical protein n=1 Tax=Tautonia marina TaxID=2653855 RepID=UPI001260ED30|nr:hypothetical protein [Tautonia marina]